MCRRGAPRVPPDDLPAWGQDARELRATVRRLSSMVRRRVGVCLCAGALLASGCGGSQASGPKDCTGGHVSNGGCVLTSPTGVTVEPRSSPTRVPVTGGTAVMRARARRILQGMGRVAIASVRFGRAPATYNQFEAVRGADWVYVTVRAPLPKARALAAQDQRDWLVWQADVFERAYLSDLPKGAMLLRGTSENVLANGVTQSLISGTIEAAQQFAPQPGRQELIAAIKRAANAAGFSVTSITITHPDRLAATAQFTVSTRHGFAQRFTAFYPILSRLGEGLDGLAWQLRDRCGTLVAQSAFGWFVNPRWECPAPGIIGIPPSPAECRKLAAQFPAC